MIFIMREWFDYAGKYTIVVQAEWYDISVKKKVSQQIIFH